MLADMNTPDSPQFARDMDLVRSILLWAEKGGVHSARPGDQTVSLCYHVKIMVEADLIHGEGRYDRIPGTETFRPGIAYVKELTWKGQEFLEACRNDTIWAKVKAEAKTRAIPLLFDTAIALAKAAAVKHGFSAA